MDLTAEQEAEARRIYEVLKDNADADLLAMARLLAGKETGELFGRTEFEVRDRVHAIGAKAIDSALTGRKKGVSRLRHRLPPVRPVGELPAVPGAAGRERVGRGAVRAGLRLLPALRPGRQPVRRDLARRRGGVDAGGSGLDEFLRVYFPRAELVLDFYHAAAEHLNELAQALHPADAGAAGELAGGWCHLLKHEGGAAVRAALEALDLRGRKADVRERHRLVTGYVRTNLYRMDFPAWARNRSSPSQMTSAGDW